MTALLNKYGSVVFSIIGALMIVGAAWWTGGTENNDTWLYVFSVWMIFFAAFEIRSSVKALKVSNIALASLIGAFAIILVAWWANGAENAELFLACVAGMTVAFFAILSQKR